MKPNRIEAASNMAEACADLSAGALLQELVEHAKELRELLLDIGAHMHRQAGPSKTAEHLQLRGRVDEQIARIGGPRV